MHVLCRILPTTPLLHSERSVSAAAKVWGEFNLFFAGFVAQFPARSRDQQSRNHIGLGQRTVKACHAAIT